MDSARDDVDANSLGTPIPARNLSVIAMQSLDTVAQLVERVVSSLVVLRPPTPTNQLVRIGEREHEVRSQEMRWKAGRMVARRRFKGLGCCLRSVNPV